MMKLTARRLERVEQAQEALALAADRLDGLALDETQRWEPGSPASERTFRVEPLQRLARQARVIHDEIDRLYS